MALMCLSPLSGECVARFPQVLELSKSPPVPNLILESQLAQLFSCLLMQRGSDLRISGAALTPLDHVASSTSSNFFHANQQIYYMKAKESFKTIGYFIFLAFLKLLKMKGGLNEISNVNKNLKWAFHYFQFFIIL